jgi:hypothetical protein
MFTKIGVNMSNIFCLFVLPAFLLGLLINPEDGGDMFLRKVGHLSTDCKALYPRM